MADFFGKEEEESTPPSKVTIAGQEYDLNEIQELVDIGKKTREVEERYNTKLDRVWPEYGKSQTKLKEYEDKLKELEAKANQNPQPTGAAEITEELREKARKEAKALGLLTQEEADARFAEMLDKSFRNRYMVEREGEKLYETAITLEKNYNGSDGRPKFVAQEMIEYMQETGIRNPEAAYKVKFEKELTDWQQKQFAERQPRDFFTESSSNAGRSRSPQEPKITNDNLNDMVAHALYGEGETQ